jgi:hypothetical protein
VAEGKSRIPDFLPFAVHILSVDLFFYLGIAADLIARGRASHRADIAYLYYLPFCSIFTSADKLHKGIAPLFMRDHQMFLPGEQLKEEMKKLNDYYSSLPPEVLNRGNDDFCEISTRGHDVSHNEVVGSLRSRVAQVGGQSTEARRKYAGCSSGTG